MSLFTRARPPRPRWHVKRAAMEIHHWRERAAELDAAEPGWYVTYEPAARQFRGYPLWDAPKGLTVTNPCPDALRDQMRAAESEHDPDRTLQIPAIAPPEPRGDAASTEDPRRRGHQPLPGYAL